MRTNSPVTLVGVGHWTCAREPQNLTYPFWSWRVSIEGVLLTDEEYMDNALGLHGSGGAEDLIRRLRPHLPSPIPNDNFEFPIGVPGGQTTLTIPLLQMSDPEGAEAVLAEFFPLVFSKAQAA